jgi:hypothetical protein
MVGRCGPWGHDEWDRSFQNAATARLWLCDGGAPGIGRRRLVAEEKCEQQQCHRQRANPQGDGGRDMSLCEQTVADVGFVFSPRKQETAHQSSAPPPPELVFAIQPDL